MVGRPRGPRLMRPSITMPADLWKQLQRQLRELNGRGEYITASAIIARLVREYLEGAKTRNRRQKQG